MSTEKKPKTVTVRFIDPKPAGLSLAVSLLGSLIVWANSCALNPYDSAKRYQEPAGGGETERK